MYMYIIKIFVNAKNITTEAYYVNKLPVIIELKKKIVFIYFIIPIRYGYLIQFVILFVHNF